MKKLKQKEFIYLIFNILLFYFIMFLAETDLVAIFGIVGGSVSSLIFVWKLMGDWK